MALYTNAVTLRTLDGLTTGAYDFSHGGIG